MAKANKRTVRISEPTQRPRVTQVATASKPSFEQIQMAKFAKTPEMAITALRNSLEQDRAKDVLKMVKKVMSSTGMSLDQLIELV